MPVAAEAVDPEIRPRRPGMSKRFRSDLCCLPRRRSSRPGGERATGPSGDPARCDEEDRGLGSWPPAAL